MLSELVDLASVAAQKVFGHVSQIDSRTCTNCALLEILEQLAFDLYAVLWGKSTSMDEDQVVVR